MSAVAPVARHTTKMTGPLIDTHVHFWRLARGDYHWLTPDRPILYRDYTPADYSTAADVPQRRGCIAVQAAPTKDETAFLCQLADQHDNILGVVGWADLAASDHTETLRRHARNPRIVGLRPMEGVPKGPAWLSGPENAPGLAAMAKNQLVLDALALPRHLPGIAQVASDHPSLQIVINHAAKPAPDDLPAWQRDIEDIAGRANVTCKLSGLTQQSTDPAHHRAVFTTLCDAFGPDRLMWGSDFPVLLETASYRAWIEITQDLLAALPPPDRAAILWGTASRVYRLER